VHKR